MTIESDFCDHWKTSALIDKCGYQAVLCLIRLWSVCQTRKTDSIPADKLERLARWDGKQNALFDALKALQFIEPTEGENVVMHDFSKVNCKMFANWKNGRKGGRPKNPTITQRKPNHNPTETQTCNSQKMPNVSNGNLWDILGKNEKSQQNKINSQSDGGILTPISPLKTPDTVKEEKEEKKENFPPDPLYKEKKEGKGETPNMRARENRAQKGGAEDAIQAFREKLQESLIPHIDPLLLEKLSDIYARWQAYRNASKNKLTPFTVRIDAKNILKCVQQGLSVQDIENLFEESMACGYRGWFWPEKILKLKASQKNNKKNTPPPPGVPVGAWNAGEMM